MNYEDSKKFVNNSGGEMLTLKEAQKLLEETGCMFPGEDQWAAVIGDNGEKDWVQIGNRHHTPGQSHT